MFDVSILENLLAGRSIKTFCNFCAIQRHCCCLLCFQANTLDQNNHWLFLIRFSLGSVLEKRKINPALHSDPKKGKNYFSLKWELSVYFSHWKINCEVQTVQLKQFLAFIFDVYDIKRPIDLWNYNLFVCQNVRHCNFLSLFQVASVAYDYLPSNGVLSRLYQNDAFIEFLRDVLGLPALYRLEDPFGACSINLFKPGKQRYKVSVNKTVLLSLLISGWAHNWHFDESQFSTTIMLQISEDGGHFEHTLPIRGGRGGGKNNRKVNWNWFLKTIEYRKEICLHCSKWPFQVHFFVECWEREFSIFYLLLQGRYQIPSCEIA